MAAAQPGTLARAQTLHWAAGQGHPGRPHGVRLVRTNTAPHCVVRQVYKAISPKGVQQLRLANPDEGPERTVTFTSATTPATAAAVAPSGDPAAGGMEGLADFLRQRGLDEYEADAAKWCEESGAAFLEEVRENLEDLAEALRLPEGERRRLLGDPAPPPSPPPPTAARLSRSLTLAVPGLAALRRVVLRPGARAPLDRTRTAPVTGPESLAAASRAARAYVPLQAWAAIKTSAAPASATAAPLVTDSGLTRTLTPAPELPGPEESPKSRRQKVRETDLYRWSPQRGPGRVTGGGRLAALRAPIPSPEELRAVADAQARQSVPDHGVYQEMPETFKELQQRFIAEHGPSIQELLPDVTLTPAQVAPKVQSRFMETVQGAGVQVLPGYHGTRAHNFEAIQRDGLAVPGNGGVKVVNGSVHGVGVYTATLDNPWLSKGFTGGCDKMFVCAIADGGPVQAAAAPPASTAAKWTGSGPRRFHRNHQKAAAASQQPAMIGNLPVHKRTEGVLHVGSAMVVFEERRVTPLLVAEGLSPTPGVRQVVYQAPGVVRQAWPKAGNPNARGEPGGGYQVGRHQVQVGDERLWAPSEECSGNKHATKVRRVWNAKARDAARASMRAAKGSRAEPEDAEADVP